MALLPITLNRTRRHSNDRNISQRLLPLGPSLLTHALKLQLIAVIFRIFLPVLRILVAS